MPLQWRNQIWQSLEEGAGKRCSECGLRVRLIKPLSFIRVTPHLPPSSPPRVFFQLLTAGVTLLARSACEGGQECCREARSLTEGASPAVNLDDGACSYHWPLCRKGFCSA